MAINSDSFNSTWDVGEIYLALQMQLHSWDSIENAVCQKETKDSFFENKRLTKQISPSRK